MARVRAATGLRRPWYDKGNDPPWAKDIRIRSANASGPSGVEVSPIVASGCRLPGAIVDIVCDGGQSAIEGVRLGCRAARQAKMRETSRRPPWSRKGRRRRRHPQMKPGFAFLCPREPRWSDVPSSLILHSASEQRSTRQDPACWPTVQAQQMIRPRGSSLLEHQLRSPPALSSRFLGLSGRGWMSSTAAPRRDYTMIAVEAGSAGGCRARAIGRMIERVQYQLAIARCA